MACAPAFLRTAISSAVVLAEEVLVGEFAKALPSYTEQEAEPADTDSNFIILPFGG